MPFRSSAAAILFLDQAWRMSLHANQHTGGEMFLSRLGIRNEELQFTKIFTLIAVFLSAMIVMTALPSEAKRSKSRNKVKQSDSKDKKSKSQKKDKKSKTQSSSSQINPNTGMPLIAPIPEIYRTPINQPSAKDSFTISGPNQNRTSAAAGESVTMSLNLKSSVAASNVTVRFTVHVLGGAPDQIVEVKNLSFRAGQSRLVRASWKLRATDRVGRVFWSADVYHNGKVVASEWSSKDRSRGYHLMFRQTTGVSVFGSLDAPVSACLESSEMQLMPCTLNGFLASFNQSSIEPQII